MKQRQIANRIVYLLLRSDIEPIRFFIATSSLLWGILLLLPGDTFERPTYTLMASLASEGVWATAHLAHSVTAIYSLFTGAKNKLIFGLDPILGAAIWTTSGIAMLASVSPVPAAIAPHLIGAVAAWWLLVRYKGPK